jgi:curli biogenesis system outer membrane secretion channel CsgG
MNKLLAFSFLVASSAYAQDEPQPEVNKISIAVLKWNPAPNKKFVLKNSGKEQTIEMDKESATLTDQFVTALVKTNKFNVVEREKLESVLKEMVLNEGSDLNEVRSAGQLMGADYILHGSVSVLSADIIEEPVTDGFVRRTTEARVVVEVRLVDATTGKIVQALSSTQKVSKFKVLPKGSKATGEGEISSAMAELQSTVANELVSGVLDGVYPIKVISVKDEVVYVSRGEEGLKVNDILQVVLRGHEIRDPDTNALLGYEETELARIQVTEATERMSKAKVLSWKAEDKTIPAGAFCKRVKEEKKTDTRPPKKKIGD